MWLVFVIKIVANYIYIYNYTFKFTLIKFILTTSNCFMYVELLWFACINGRPLLNIANITIPNEYISLWELQYEDNWTSGAKMRHYYLLLLKTNLLIICSLYLLYYICRILQSYLNYRQRIFHCRKYSFNLYY